jgi:Mce-associated membrane protein
MPTPEERTLKLIKGGRPGRASRTVPRRVITPRMPTRVTPVEDLLRTLDEQPVQVDGTEPSEVLPPPDLAESTELPEPTDRAAGGTGAPAVRPPARRRLLMGLLVVALVVALTAAGFFGHRWQNDRSQQAAREAALAAAKQTTVNFVSVSAATVDRDLQRISAGATGEFKEQFTRGQPQVRKAIVENRVESRGMVLRAGLVSADRRSAVVLVAVDATVKNVKAPEGRVSHYRIQVDLTRDAESGAWLVSRLQFVG